MESLQRKVIAILSETLKSNTIDENSELGRTPRWDSLRHVLAILAIERGFGVKLGAENLASLTSVKTLVAHLGKLGLS